MQLGRRPREVAREHQRHHRTTSINRRVDRDEFVAPRRMQYEIGDLLCEAQRSGGPDADAHAPEIGAAERRLDIAQAVVARVAPALLDFDLPRHEVEFVVQHKHVLGRQFVKAHQGANASAGAWLAAR